jgi:hypothetical protein
LPGAEGVALAHPRVFGITTIIGLALPAAIGLSRINRRAATCRQSRPIANSKA